MHPEGRRSAVHQKKTKRSSIVNGSNRPKRREFVRQAAAFGAGVAAAGVGALSSQSVAAQQRWDDECDVLVVGTGGAGFAAAIEAADTGAKVMMIDKAKWFGGRTVHSTGDCQMPVSHIQ